VLAARDFHVSRALKLQIREGSEFPFREDHVRLLEERFAEHRKDPSQSSTWEEVKRRIQAGRR
jgi:putative addiction module component (TIGR02574 family)